MKRTHGFTHIALMAVSLFACSEGFTVGADDGGTQDAALGDASSVPDANGLDAASVDAASMDAISIDDAITADAGCPAPWLVTLVQRTGAPTMELWRLSLAADGTVRRCLSSEPIDVPARGTRSWSMPRAPSSRACPV